MRTIGLLVAATLVAVSMIASGCVANTGGQLGHAQFSYEECPFGCTIAGHSMAAGGARATIKAQLNSGYSFSQVKSSNPQSAEFTIGSGDLAGGYNIGVVSAGAGSTELQLIDANNKLVDQVTVNVANVTKLGFTKGWNGNAPLVLENTTQSFHVVTEDELSNPLIGTGAVAFDAAGTVHKVDAGGFGDIQGFAGVAGSGTVVAHTPTSSTTLPVTVVPASAIAGVTNTVNPNTASGGLIYANVDVVANTSTGSVYGATCAWTTSDASVTVSSQTSTGLEQSPKSSTSFLLALPGTFTATCTIGSVTTTATLHR